jgi:glycosyltransferase involved in cell wall biosynthesis
MGKKLATEIKQHEPFDIIHCHDFRTAQVVGQMNIPSAVVTVRDYAFICGSPNNILADGSPCPGCENLGAVIKNRAVGEAPWWRKPWRIWQYWHNIAFRKETLSAFKHQIFISLAQKKIISARYSQPDAHQAVIYNSVPDSYIAARPVRAVGKTILFAGTVESYKGVGLLLEAFRALSGSEGDVHLKIVGTGAQWRQYEQQVARWGLQYRVTFTGRVSPERMGSVYDEALLVVSPHVWDEPFGRTVIEAMARERIVVAAKAGGPAEIIQPGVTGFLFERGSAAALCQALEKALHLAEIDRQEIQQAARRWVRSNLGLAHIAGQYADFYRQAL